MPMVKNTLTGETVAECDYDDEVDIAKCRALAAGDPNLVFVDTGGGGGASYGPGSGDDLTGMMTGATMGGMSGGAKGYAHGGEVVYGPEPRGMRGRATRGRRGPRIIGGK